MSEFKHTPGPWEVVNNPPNEDGSTATSIYGSDQYVADVYCGYAGSRNMPNAEAAANARLIAAAPDLLEALDEMLFIYGVSLDSECRRKSEHELDVINQAYDAIAKATGTTK